MYLILFTSSPKLSVWQLPVRKKMEEEGENITENILANTVNFPEKLDCDQLIISMLATQHTSLSLNPGSLHKEHNS